MNSTSSGFLKESCSALRAGKRYDRWGSISVAAFGRPAPDCGGLIHTKTFVRCAPGWPSGLAITFTDRNACIGLYCLEIVHVFFTVDTEFHPTDGKWSEQSLAHEVRRDIDGITSEGEFGTFFQADLLNAHGLKGVFFVEALSSYAAGMETLKRVTGRLREGGHEVGLHLHPEWLRRGSLSSILEGRQGGMMRVFSEDDQATLIGLCIDQLHRCGVETVHSFRAGGYAANLDTLTALARNRVPFDSSYNVCWSGITCDIRTEEPMLQPRQIRGVYEFPVSFFQDWPGHYRHAELCACSSQELEFALFDAWKKGWCSFVIVSHSFELIKGRDENNDNSPYRADRTVIRRFRRLCEFLANHRDKFQTSTFEAFDLQSIPSQPYNQPLSGFFPNTVWRFAEQAWRRIL